MGNKQGTNTQETPGICRICGGQYGEHIPGNVPAIVAISEFGTICYRCANQEARRNAAKEKPEVMMFKADDGTITFVAGQPPKEQP